MHAIEFGAETCGQAWPQEPQLLMSVWVLTHAPPAHDVKPDLHAHAPAPLHCALLAQEAELTA